MFGDLDWPLTAPCGFVSIRWASYYIFIWNHSTTTENLLQVTWDNIHFVLVDSHCTQLSLPFWGDCGASSCASFSLSTRPVHTTQYNSTCQTCQDVLPVELAHQGSSNYLVFDLTTKGSCLPLERVAKPLVSPLMPVLPYWLIANASS